MASVLKHLRSSTADKRPTASGLADGQLAINTASGTPGLYFEDSAGNIVKVGPAHVGTAAPNASPAGSTGNSKGELWVDENTTTPGLKYYNGSSFINLTPSGTQTTVGLVELATDAETQAGTDTVRAVTPSGLQSKISDSTSTASSTTIASATAVKSAYDLANAALPKTGGTVTGAVVISPSGSLSFEGATDNDFETLLSPVDPTADRTFFIPDITGTGITTSDTGTVTNGMLAGSIADSKLDTISTADKVSLSALNIDGGTDIGAALADADLFIVDDGGAGTNRKAAATRITDYAFGKVSGDVTISSAGAASIGAGVIVNADINASAAIDYSKLAALTSANILVGNASNVATSTAVTGDVTISNAGVTAISSGVIVDADISASAEIAVSKLADGSARQLLQTDAAGTGVEWASNIDIPGTLDVTSTATFDGVIGASAGAAATPSITFTGDLNTGIYSPNADQVAISTGGSERARINSSGDLGIGTSSTINARLHARAANSDTIAALLRLEQLNAAGTDSARLVITADAANNTVAYDSTGTNAGAHAFTSAGTERARIDSSGYLRLAGAGIQFNGDTAAANALNDYEQGTWTPVVADAASAGNTGTGTFYGHYTKVGNIVTATVSLTNIVTTGMTAANDLFIRGLPFTCDSLTGTVIFAGAVLLGNISDGGNGGQCLAIADNTSYIRIGNTNTTNVAITYSDVSHFTSGSADVYGTITYQAA